MVCAREQGRACQPDGQITCVVERVRERGNWTSMQGGVHAGVSTGVELRYQLHPRWLVTSRAVVGQTTSFLLSSEGPPNDTFDRGIAHRQWRVGLSYVR